MFLRSFDNLQNDQESFSVTKPLDCSQACVQKIENCTSCSDHRLKFTFILRHLTLFNMGLKGFYGYCLKEVKDCHKTVNIIEEIAKYRRLAKSFVYGYLRI